VPSLPKSESTRYIVDAHVNKITLLSSKFLERSVQNFDISGRAIECFPNIFYLLKMSFLSPTIPLIESELSNLQSP
jgi:hypothetical protein